MSNFIDVTVNDTRTLINLDQVAYAEIGKEYANLLLAFTGRWDEKATAETWICLRGESFEKFKKAVGI